MSQPGKQGVVRMKIMLLRLGLSLEILGAAVLALDVFGPNLRQNARTLAERVVREVLPLILLLLFVAVPIVHLFAHEIPFIWRVEPESIDSLTPWSRSTILPMDEPVSVAVLSLTSLFLVFGYIFYRKRNDDIFGVRPLLPQRWEWSLKNILALGLAVGQFIYLRYATAKFLALGTLYTILAILVISLSAFLSVLSLYVFAGLVVLGILSPLMAGSRWKSKFPEGEWVRFSGLLYLLIGFSLQLSSTWIP